jgi:3-phosphoshikimate 1-carboxyvinyltransferase
MGVGVERDGQYIRVKGVGLRGLVKPDRPLNVGNSGTSMRLLAGILAGQNFESELVAVEGLSKRPMERIVEPLQMMGAEIAASSGGFPPLRIKPAQLKPMEYTLPIPSAQVKSAVLLAGLYAAGRTVVVERTPSRDHTERMMRYFGADLRTDGLRISVNGGTEMAGKRLIVPGDISSASFFIAGAILLGSSSIKIKGVGMNSTRSGILNILSRMGAVTKVMNIVNAFEPYCDMEVRSCAMKGIVINENEIPVIIDELPIIFVLASLAKGRTVIKGAGELKVKETDRIESMRWNLEKMGARIFAEKDQIIIEGVKRLKGANIKSYGDHRTVMSMAIAALAASGASVIDDVECVNKSFPQFFELLDTIRC